MAEADVLLVGARDLEPYQWQRLRSSEVVLTQLGDAPARIDGLGSRRAYLHLDLDVLDKSEGQANRFAAPGGPLVVEVEALVGEAGRRLSVEAAALSAYSAAAAVASATRAQSAASYTVLEHAERRDVGPEDHQLSLRVAIVLADPLMPFAVPRWAASVTPGRPASGRRTRR